ncbi:MAG: porphobilinogen synthase [Gammaproteobacteria bacterium]|nr:porphobilinogen synthase [Gammaproteobacteria bacterium]
MAAMSLRRLRDNRHIRELTREVRLHPEQFIQPLFVVEGLREREAVAGLTDVWRDTPASLLRQIEADLGQGISKFLLFGVPAQKQERNFSHTVTTDNIAAIRRQFGNDVWLAVDVCLCSHTTHGHCGILNDRRDHVLNDTSVTALAAAALQFAEAGADCVAPSDMQDGRIAAIRAALDQAGRERTAIMSYAAKFNSAFYGPFRLAAESAPGADLPLRDRASYQIDPARPADALLCAERDAAEGADILMVKPGLPYLDVLAMLSARIHKPWAVYQTSGEQAGIDLPAERGLADAQRAQLESWTAFARAGASMIISYAARRARRYLGA